MASAFRSHLLGTWYPLSHGHCLFVKFVGFGLNQFSYVSPLHHHWLCNANVFQYIFQSAHVYGIVPSLPDHVELVVGVLNHR